MTDIPELDPSAIRKTLVRYRELGLPFDRAWPFAARPPKPADYINTGGLSEARALYRFMRSHFQAAYYDSPSSLGRCNVSELDWHDIRRVPVSVRQDDARRCQSGDGCDRRATCGRWGKNWCQRHGAELVRLAEKLASEAERNRRGRPIVGVGTA